MCRSVLDRLNSSVVIEQREIVIGASVGLARSTTEERLLSSELLRRSDVAMYMSKRNGRKRCTWFNETFDQRREAMRELDDEMRRGVAAKEFAVIYQPLVDADTHEIVAVEALVRWNRPDGRNVGPHIFIPVAEESGLINAIGHYVLRQAVADAMRWPDIVLSVNISAAQLRNPEFPIQLGEVLEETGFPPERLELEITETCLVLDPVVAARTLALIRGFGVHIALDDFGTGYASIGFLRQFRFEKLKLDRSLVVQSENDEGSRAMMVSSVTVARALKMVVTAEGVETKEQAELARTAGCDQIQGWLYFRAMPARDIDQLITDQRAAQAGQTATIEPQTSGHAA
jgi:EAL domain-containing protein (putative c-di-GMP-specific phosphodiesterase class I)